MLEVGKKIKACERKLDKIAELDRLYDDCKGYIELSEETREPSLDKEIEDSLHLLESKVEEAKIETLLSGKYDSYNAIMTLHSGAGGTEAQDWTEMLYRMYKMYCDKQGYSLRVLDVLNGDEAGLKSITFEVDGENAYGFLKAEKGVHRLVRISPFNANGKRQTSFASLEVSPVIVVSLTNWSDSFQYVNSVSVILIIVAVLSSDVVKVSPIWNCPSTFEI